MRSFPINLSPPVIALNLLMIAGAVDAAPVISGATGTFSQGSSIVLSGTGFGATAPNVEWTGANIEAGAVGNLFSKPQWSGSGDWSHVNYANDFVHSGKQSLKVRVDPVMNWNGTLIHGLPNPTAASSMLYVSWWVRYVGATNGQWKMLRLSGIERITDGAQELVLFNWFGSNQLVIDPGTNNDQSLYPPSNVFADQGGTWYRQELWVSTSSTGSTNGKAQLNRYGGGVFNSYQSAAIKTHVTNTDTYSYVIFQNYFGNFATGNGNSPTVWLDDIYIANSAARIEVCDSATWATRTHCELQIPTAWSDSSVTFTVQQGSLQNGNAYLYVVDSSNAASSARVISFGTTSSTLRPQAPTLLMVR